MRAITMQGCRANADAASRRRMAASCTRAIEAARQHFNPTPSECQKAHERFLARLRREVERVERAR